MAGVATSNDGDSSPKGPRGAVRKWTAVAFAFTATIAIAAMLVNWQLEQRREELDTQFSMSAARIGRAIELKYQSHREVVNNVTNVLRLAESEARGPLLEVEGARAKTDLNQQLENAADTLKTELEGAKKQQVDADERKTEAWNAAFKAVDDCMDALGRSTDAQDRVVDAALAVNAAQAQLELALSALNGETSKKDSPPPSPNVQQTANVGSIGLLRERLEKAQDSLLTEKKNADAADKLAVTACGKAGDGREAVAAAEASAAAATRVEKAAAQAARAAQGGLETTAGVEKAKDLVLRSASDLRSPSHVIAAGMKRHLPPSYAREVDECASHPTDVELCLANAIAKINRSPAPLIRCPSLPSGQRIGAPTLTEDGGAVDIPSADQREHVICARVPLDDLLSIRPSAQARPTELENAKDGDFDAALLLTADGTVLKGLDGGQSHLRIAKFPGLTARQIGASSMVANLELGPDKYRTFLQPVRVALGGRATPAAEKAPATGERHDVIVAGLVREARLAASATQISLTSYLWFVLLLAFGLLCLPLAKLWFLGTRSAFGRFDVTLLGASAILITLLTIVLTLGFVAHNRLARRMDLELGGVASTLGSRLSDMVLERAKQLDTFLREPHRQCDKSTTTDAVFAGEGAPRKVCELAELGNATLGRELVFLTDAEGRQTVKYTNNTHTTTPLSVGFRDYFQRAHGREPVCLKAGGCGMRVVPEVVRSATSRKFVLVVARNVDHETLVGEQGANAGLDVPIGSHVAALEAELPLQDLVLPLGFQAAVIAEDGTAMLHSDADARFGQKLFDDVDDATDLRAAIASNVPKELNVRYLGVPSRLSVRPLMLEGTRWYAIAVAPRSLVDVASVNMGLTALAGYGVVLLGVVLLAFFLVLATATFPWLLGLRGQAGSRKPNPLRLGPSLRPNCRFPAEYGTVGLHAARATLAISTAAFVWFSFSVIWLLLTIVAGCLVLVCLPGLGIHGPLASTHARLTRWRAAAKKLVWKKDEKKNLASDKPAEKPRLWVNYPLALSGLVGILVIAPSSALFASAYDYHAECAVRAEQHHFLQALSLRPECLARNKTPNACQNVIRSAGNATREGASAAPADDAVALWLNPLPWLARRIPVLGSQVPGMLSLSGLAEGTGRLFSFARRPRTVAVNDAAGSELFSVAVPSLLEAEYTWGHLGWTALAFGTFLGVGWVTAACTLRRLFFLKLLADQRETKRIDIEWLLDAKNWDERRLILLLHPSNAWQAELERARGRFVDFATLTEAQLAKQDPGTVWLISNLEASLDDAKLAERIAKAAPNARRFVIQSDLEPLRRVKPELLEAWSKALYAFREEEAAPLEASELLRPTTAAMTMWWQSCDDDERRVLSQLALEGYTNPHPANFPAIRHLAGRGLLRADKLTISSPAFAEYVKHATSPEEARRWEDSGEGTVWQSIRVPLSTGVATLLGALAVSKPELGIASALVPLATVSLPSILKVLAATISKSAT